MKLWAGLVGGAMGALLLFAAPPSAAADERMCRAECQEARKICHRAAAAAKRACQARCDEDVASALRRAREICVEERLEPRECGKVVHQAIHAASRACREDCREVTTRAKTICREERTECRRACLPPFDSACVQDCRGEFGTCREETGECLVGCRAGLAQAVEDCRHGTSDMCDPKAVRECIHEARREAYTCGEDCYEATMCAADVHECLRECVVDE